MIQLLFRFSFVFTLRNQQTQILSVALSSSSPCYFSPSHATITPSPYIFFVLPEVCVCVFVYVCVRGISHAVISSQQLFKQLKEKVFFCQKALSLFPWCYYYVKIPQKKRGGGKKINVPHHRQQPQHRRLRRSSTNANTCIHRQQEAG